MALLDKYLGIKESFDEVLRYSQGIPKPQTDELFENWYQNKRDYIEWFGGELIHEFGEFEFHVDQEKKSNLVDTFLNQVAYILPEREFSNFYQFVKSNQDSFFENLVSEDRFALNVGKTGVKKGMKLSRAFKFFVEDKEQLNTIQQTASKYIQQDKIKGILCISVHPLDFLSASETTYNWRSCHSLDGEYRAGNLSYMGDNATCMLYLKGEYDEILPNFPTSVRWNSKKWRMLCFLDKDWKYCFLGRQYPFEVEGISNEVRRILPGFWVPFTNKTITTLPVDKEILEERMGRSFLVDHAAEFILSEPYIGLKNYGGMDLYKIGSVIHDAESELHYNDLLYSSYYKPYYSSRADGRDHDIVPYIKIGYNCHCINCGQQVITKASGHMLCEDCAIELGYANEGMVQCAVCGEWYDEDDVCYTRDGDAVCNHCISDGVVHYCENCNEFYYEDDMIYSEKYEEWFCKDCFDNLQEEEMEHCLRYLEWRNSR